MILSRRQLVAASAALAATGGRARAADYPTKPIRFIVGLAAGGSADFTARLIGEALGARLGQPVVVENKTGATGAIALDYVAKSPPDGYTLGIASSAGTSMLEVVKANLPYNITKDFSYISRFVDFDYVLNVSTKLPFRTMAELVTYAKANPGKLRCGTIGIGSATHMATLRLEQQGGFKTTTVPYRGAAGVLPDLLAGTIDIGFLTVQDSTADPSGEKIRQIAITGPVREPTLPHVPTMKEAGYPGATMTIWLGLVGQAKLPPAILDRLGKALLNVLNDPVVQQRFVKLGFRPAPLIGEDFRKLVMAEYAQWQDVVTAAHLVVE